MTETPSELLLQPTLDPEALDRLGQKLDETFKLYEKERSDAELQWAKNYRQYKGLYDSNVVIPADQSKAYPKLTRVKVVTMVSRLMDMLFPQTEKNWGLAASPVPDIAQEDLQLVLDGLQQQLEPGAELSSDDIEDAVMELAKKRMKRMDATITDQLTEIDYVQLVRGVVRSAVRYGTGVLKGPFNKTVKSRKWVKNPAGRYEAIERTVYRPIFDFVPLWDYYPDLTAKTWDTMNGEFQRHVMDYHNVMELAGRADFMGKRVRQFLRDNPEGNWVEKSFETELRGDSSDRKNIRTSASSKKYEIIEWWGRVKGKDLQAIGLKIGEQELEKELEANIWSIGGIVIKAALNPFRGKVRLFHQFVFEDDDASLIGEGLPHIMRDSQMACCASARMLLDNASVVCGPMLEMNKDLLTPGQSLNPHARKIYQREGLGSEATHPAIRELRVDSHINELSSIFNMFKQLADEETVLPPQASGQMSAAGTGKEAYRTAQGTSMLLGAAALPIRDIVRNFDKFTTSVIGSLLEWNMMFNDDPTIRGDFQPIARGSTSLIAKEIRAQALDQLAYTLSPDDKKLVRPRELLRERLIVRDLGVELLKDDKEVAADAAAEQDKLARMDQFTEAMNQATLRESASKSARNEAQASKTAIAAETDAQRAQLDAIQTQMEVVNG